ncbi:hypothetical protein [Enterococcus faecium]|uniref:hypothetical protein n=1 Tax=Enterococcus faecium TaxID=1352 RepID=UPI0002825E81|nr:hypothetical protein [Enterococcus faecium]EJX88531.1 hypothetical protein HMPREF1368_00286 [Enterococcus faecium ERV69]MBJ8174899.1 hypothetical protein [Enterococcus faecium]QQF31091.1 hypothetical protein JCP87_15380 [Enterococcus faecium]
MLIDYNYKKGLNIMFNSFFNKMFSGISLFGVNSIFNTDGKSYQSLIVILTTSLSGE